MQDKVSAVQEVSDNRTFLKYIWHKGKKNLYIHSALSAIE